MIVLNKKELKTLCDTGERHEQIAQLMEWGIPFRVTKITGNVKVLRADLHFTANSRAQQGPNYDSINTTQRLEKNT